MQKILCSNQTIPKIHRKIVEGLPSSESVVAWKEEIEQEIIRNKRKYRRSKESIRRQNPKN